MLAAIGQLLIFLLNVYFWIIMAGVVLSWLIAFEVVNIRNPQAANLIRLIHKLTEPVYKPLRRYIPPIAGIDFSPIVIIFGIYFLQGVIAKIFLM